MDGLERRPGADQIKGLVELKHLRVEAVKPAQDFDPQQTGVQHPAIGQRYPDTLTGLSFEGARDGHEPCGLECDPGNPALSQILGKLRAVDPGRPSNSKGVSVPGPR